MVYQQFVNYPSFTVYDNIASPLKLAGLAKAEIDRRCARPAPRCISTRLLKRLPAELSGGQQQRTASRGRWSRKRVCCCSMSRWSTWTTSCARSCAPRCARSSTPARRSSSMPRPSRWRRCCWAAPSRCFTRAACFRAGRRVRGLPQPVQPCGWAQVFSDPPMNLVDGVVATASGCCRRTASGFQPRGIWRDLPPWPLPLGVRAEPPAVAPRAMTAHSGARHGGAGGDQRAPRPSSTSTLRRRAGSSQQDGVHRLQLGAAGHGSSSIRAGCSPSSADGRLVAAPPRPAAGGGVGARMARIELRAPRPLLQRRPASTRTGAASRWTCLATTAAPTRCSGHPLRQDHAAEHHLRLAAPSAGRRAVRRPRCHRAAAAAAQHRPGVPVPGHLRHDDGASTTSPSRCATAASAHAEIRAAGRGGCRRCSS